MEHKILQAISDLAAVEDSNAVSPDAVATQADIDPAAITPAAPALQKQGLIAIDDFGMLSLTELGAAKLAVKDPGL